MERDLMAFRRHRYAPLFGFLVVYVLLAAAVHFLAGLFSGPRTRAPLKVPRTADGAGQLREKQPDELKAYLVPSDDARKYHILEQRPDEEPTDQAQWDRWVAKTFRQEQVFHDLRLQGAFPTAALSTEELDRRLHQLTASIRSLEEHVKTHPQDETARKDLQGLYLMKSTLGSLARSAGRAQAQNEGDNDGP